MTDPLAAPTRCTDLGRRQRCTGKELDQSRLSAAHRCRSLIVAATQGFAQPFGLTLNLQRQNSRSALRDKLIGGELDAAHGLYGLIYAVHLGIGGSPAVDMAVLMGRRRTARASTCPPC